VDGGTVRRRAERAPIVRAKRVGGSPSTTRRPLLRRPLCFNATKLSPADLIAGAEVQGTVPMWDWIGDEGPVSFSQ
jgi:hypothetical protein